MRYTVFLQNDLDQNFQGKRIITDIEAKADGSPNTIKDILVFLWRLCQQRDREIFTEDGDMHENVQIHVNMYPVLDPYRELAANDYILFSKKSDMQVQMERERDENQYLSEENILL